MYDIIFTWRIPNGGGCLDQIVIKAKTKEEAEEQFKKEHPDIETYDVRIDNHISARKFFRGVPGRGVDY